LEQKGRGIEKKVVRKTKKTPVRTQGRKRERILSETAILSCEKNPTQYERE